MGRLSSEAMASKEKQTRDHNSSTSLSLTHRALSDVSNISDLKNLERLDLSSNNLTSLEGLRSCVNLKWLSVVQNKLQSLRGVDAFTKLIVLNAGKNKLRGMDEVVTVVSLRALILNDNEIQSICNLDQMKDLNTLVLSRNPVNKIGASLAKLKSITKISLSNCKLESIDSSIKGCVELKELRLAHNDIKALPVELAHLTRLQNLDMGNNSIMRWSDLQVLSSLHGLKNLNLQGNPIAENHKLVKKIRKLVPGLQILNAKPVEKFTKNEKGNQVEETLFIAETKDKKKHGHADISEGRLYDENDGLTRKRQKRKSVGAEEDDAILLDKKELEGEDKGGKESETGAKKRERKGKEYMTEAALVKDDGVKTKPEKKSKRKAQRGDLEIVDDGETPFTELLAGDAADSVNYNGLGNNDKAARDIDAISGLVSFPKKAKKTKKHGSGAPAFQFLATATEVGLGGPSAWDVE